MDGFQDGPAGPRVAGHEAYFENSLARALMNQIDCGLVVCDATARMVYANRAARLELASRKTLWEDGSTLRCSSACRTALSAAVRDAAARSRSCLLLLGSVDDGLTIIARPFAIGGFAATSALLMIGRRRPCSTLAIEMLCMCFHLTFAERRVLKGLIDHRAPREIAEEHGVSMPTVRTQIQSIREKIGVRSIDELLLYAARIPPVDVVHECLVAQ